MRELKVIDLTEKNLEKIASWKGDYQLCDLIMANPVNLTNEEVKNWHTQNSMDQYQELLGIHLNGELVGIGRLMYINMQDKVAEIGLYLGGVESRGAGLGKFTIDELENLAQEKWGLNKVFARVRETNISSKCLFQKQGFLSEGILKKHYKTLKTSEWDDVIYMSKFLKT